ncbi:MAG: VOC family protein [Chloroflexi bacterium]|jgi:catechol 2,3-dioxygenase-like lactoylglutathione lyase family enzyme|nr:hypothetical protein [Anaerolineae bacterium]MCC6565731.1 VOC family protein [Chloroflexota bacterium]OQY84601.1 MAG: hypothetical protein B6D42_04990 [Anaerolineae bacterium UTCFX5]RIK23163.1 MAG: glyoxalase [Chloroflexota bacterium]
MPLPKIDSQITFLYTLDLDASAHFYGTILELPLWLDQGGCKIYQINPAAYVGICRAGTIEAQRVSQQPNVIFTLVTEDVDAFFAALVERGARVEQWPKVNEHYAIYNGFVRDPSGYLIEIQRFLPRDPVSS